MEYRLIFELELTNNKFQETLIMKKAEGKSSSATSKVPTTKKATGKTAVSKKVSGSNHLPDYEAIRVKAEEIYRNRLEKGEWGTPEGDWHAAEDYFRSR
jgi:hypothetical protein